MVTGCAVTRFLPDGTPAKDISMIADETEDNRNDPRLDSIREKRRTSKESRVKV